MSEIDLVQYGALTAQVASLERDVAELKSDMKTLLELANKSRGGLWMGMGLASTFGGIVGFVADHWMK